MANCSYFHVRKKFPKWDIDGTKLKRSYFRSGIISLYEIPTINNTTAKAAP